MKYAIILLLLVTILVAGCSTQETTTDQQTENQIPQDETTEQSVATVNGNAISDSDVQTIQQTQQITQQEAVEQAINQELLIQESPEVSEAEARQFLEQQLALQGLNISAYEQQLVQTGQSLDDQLKLLQQQLGIQEYVEAQVAVSKATETEVEQYYNQLANQSNQTPPLDQVRGDIVTAIEQQKQQQALNDLIMQLRQSATIEYTE